MTIYQTPQRYAVYSSEMIQAWEQRWFAQGHQAYGLMQQASYFMAQRIMTVLQQHQLTSQRILVWCGGGKNAGDGYLVAHYLVQRGLNVAIYATVPPSNKETQQAVYQVLNRAIPIYQHAHELPEAGVHIDALLGNGLNRPLSLFFQQIIQTFNQQQGYKIALDLPSGLHPNTGMPVPIAIQADLTLCLLGLKLGVCIGQSSAYVGELHLIPLIPEDTQVEPTAYFDVRKPMLPQRLSYQHKGNFGHVLVIGGHRTMGGAVMMAAEASMACGAGKVSVMCDDTHHQAILTRSPNAMVQSLEDTHWECLKQVNTVAFGMGLGRDAWAERHYRTVMEQLQLHAHLTVILDADALWFLALSDLKLPDHWIATPHAAEAGRLLNCSANDIEQDRIYAIQQLQHRYGGSWVLKGAGSLSLERQLSICAFGTAKMATAGMGDVLSGVIAGLKAQSKHFPLADCVAVHAWAGEQLAKTQHTIQAHHMAQCLSTLYHNDE